MKTISTIAFTLCVAASIFFAACGQNTNTAQAAVTPKPEYGGFESKEEYGRHLVTICGCNDCHTPKKMGPHGLVLDSALMLSGHPSAMPAPDVNVAEMESKGIICTNDLTAWRGPWGTSYAANLTPDATGLGNWEEDNFFRAIRHGKFKGLENSRTLLPPMPWEMFRNMTDYEIKAIFAYLKSIHPVKNIVPAPEAPASAVK